MIAYNNCYQGNKKAILEITILLFEPNDIAYNVECRQQ